MKPKIITVLFSFVFSISSFAATIQYDGPWMWNDINVKTTTSIGGGDVPTSYVTCKGTIAIRGYKNQVTSLEIPKKIEWSAEEWGENFLEYGDHVLLARVVYDLDVIAIADYAFSGSRYQKLETVSIPNTVTKIGASAFYGCLNLKSIVIPNSVAEIGIACFDECTSLASVTLPSGLKNISRSLFYGCENLSSIDIPNTVTNIGSGAFQWSGLTSVILPESIESLGSCAFGYCDELRKLTVNGPKNLRCSGDNEIHDNYLTSPFAMSTNIEEIVIGNQVKTIGEQVFCRSHGGSHYDNSYPYHLVSLCKLEIGAGVTNIGSSAFGGCEEDDWEKWGRSDSLKELIIPQNVKTIGAYAFAYLAGVTNLEINGVTEIDRLQFCVEKSALQALTIGPGVERIGTGAFGRQYRYWYVPSRGDPYWSNSICNQDRPTLSSVKFTGKDLRDIGAYAFEWSTALSEIAVPETVTNVDDYAFGCCSCLANAVLPSKMLCLGEYAFSECSALKEISIPFSIKKCGKYAFYNCTSLTKANLEDGLAVLSDSMFSGSGLTSIRIPSSVKNVGRSAFSPCKQLENVIVEEGVECLSDSMFSGCVALPSITLPKSLKEIGSSAFSGCSKLATVKLEAGIKAIGRSAFASCVALRSIAIPGSVTDLGVSAFSGDTALTSVSLSEGNKVLGDSAFKGCVGLRAISFPESLRRIGVSTFSGCTALSTISFPSGVEEVGAGAFSGCSVKSLLFDNSNGAFLDDFSKESMKTLFVGASADGIDGSLLADCTSLETIMVAKNSSKYSVDDCGVLFDKGKTKLIKYPCAASHQSYTAPETVKSVDDGAFAFASALRDIDFPAGLMTVGESAFDWCLGLGSVSFPATLRTIGTGAFTTCPSLEDLYFEGNAPAIGDNQFWYSSPVFHVQENTTGWDAVAERFDVEVVIGEGSGGEDSPALTMDWLAKYPTLWSAAGGDLETAAKMTAANGLTLDECYIAGLDPTDPDSKFEARIDIVNGQPVVTWKPQLDKADAALRTYTTYGCNELGGDWVDFDAATPEIKATLRFFKVCVDMK